MNIDLTPIIQAVIALIAAIVTAKVIPWIKAKTTKEQQQLISATVKTLVFAAEQIYGSGFGAEKMEYVMMALKNRGFNVDKEEVEAVIKENLAALHATKPASENKE